VRTADYRIVYEIDDDVLLVLVLTMGHRREIYRKHWTQCLRTTRIPAPEVRTAAKYSNTGAARRRCSPLNSAELGQIPLENGPAESSGRRGWVHHLTAEPDTTPDNADTEGPGDAGSQLWTVALAAEKRSNASGARWRCSWSCATLPQGWQWATVDGTTGTGRPRRSSTPAGG
jgi:hypothetical protein